jgi:hypothetical protein
MSVCQALRQGLRRGEPVVEIKGQLVPKHACHHIGRRVNEYKYRVRHHEC